MKSILSILAAAVLALLAGIAAATEPAPSASGQAEPFSAQQIQFDFRALYQGLRDAHFDLYARRPKAAYDALFHRMLGGFKAPMDRLDVTRAFQRFVAFGRVAHANIAFPQEFERWRLLGGAIFPLGVRVIAGEVVIAEELGAVDQVEPGDVLLQLDGEPALAWIERVGAHVSADNEHMANTLIESRFPALLWLQIGARDGFSVKLRRRDGTVHDVVVPALSRDQMRASAASADDRFELDWDAREVRMLDDRIAYLRPGPFYDNDPAAAHPWDTTAFGRFIDQAFADFIEQDARALLIDLRSNPGGDNSFSDLMVSWFADRPFRFASSFRIKVSAASTASNAKRLSPDDPPASMTRQLADAYAAHAIGEQIEFDLPYARPRESGRFDAPVFVLIDRHSYSNAANVAALVQDYGFATVLGEETADLATTYGAMEQFTLPHTGIVVGYPKALIVRPSGDPAARGVVPDIALAPSEVAARSDVVLKSALDAVHRRLMPGEGGGTASQ